MYFRRILHGTERYHKKYFFNLLGPTRPPSNVHIKVALTYSVEFSWDAMNEASGYRVSAKTDKLNYT